MPYAYSTYAPAVYNGEIADPFKVARILMTAGWQKRKNPIVFPLLMKIAQERAEDMVRRSYFSHTTPDGITVNEHARSAGYILPSWYAKKGNNLESIYIGHDEPEAPINSWFDSAKHRDHLTGDISFYAEQKAIGVGSSKAKDGRQIYVFISAPIMG